MRQGKSGGGGSTARVSSPAFCGAAAVFWGIGVGNRRESVRNRVQGFSTRWGARELTLWGGAAGSPRRRRGGGRLGGSGSGVGAWHGRGGSSARKEGGGAAPGRRVGASAKQRRSRSWPGRRRAARRGSAVREAGEQGERRKGACLQYPKIPRT